MITTFSMAILAQLAIIPADIQASIDKALATDDQFIIEAVTAKAARENPNYAEDINDYLAEKITPEQEPIANLSPAAGITEAANGWSGNVEGGLMVQTGNSENENLNGAIKLVKETQDWKHTAKASAANNSSDGNRSSEEYRAGIKSDYGLSPTDYVYGEVDWVKDRYSGYEYRLSEYLGYGHKYYDTDELKLSAEAGLGLQQSKQEGFESENNFVQKIAGDLEWAINDALTFTQHLSTEHASGVFFSLSESALRTKISETLALKVGYNMEHISEVPAGTKKLDTKTMVNVLYEFK